MFFGNVGLRPGLLGWILVSALTQKVAAGGVEGLLGEYFPDDLLESKSVSPLKSFKCLTAYGKTADRHEGYDVPKERIYEIHGREVDEREFFEQMAAHNLTMGFDSRANRRAYYPNQDNFLVDVCLDADGKPMFGLYGVFDGHSMFGHYVSEMARRSLLYYGRLELQEFLDDVEAEEKAAKSGTSIDEYRSLVKGPGRERRMAEVVRALFLATQEEYNLNSQNWEIPGWSLVVKLAEGSPFYDPRSAKRAFFSSGATMSIILVDFKDENMYVGNAGDSPVWVKYASPDSDRDYRLTNTTYPRNSIQKVSTEHNMASKKEMDATVQRLLSKGYQLKESVAIQGERQATVYIVFKKTSRFPLHALNQETNIDITVHFAGAAPAFDYRLGQVQMSRAIGHWHGYPGETSVPDVTRIDLEMTPVEYFVAASDGLTHQMNSILSEALIRKDFQEEIRRVMSMKEEERQNTRIELPLLVSWKHLFVNSTSSEEVLENLGRFMAHAEALTSSVEVIEKALLQKVVENFDATEVNQVSDGMFNISRIISNMEERGPTGEDDFTGIFVPFERTRVGTHFEKFDTLQFVREAIVKDSLKTPNAAQAETASNRLHEAETSTKMPSAPRKRVAPTTSEQTPTTPPEQILSIPPSAPGPLEQPRPPKEPLKKNAPIKPEDEDEPDVQPEDEPDVTEQPLRIVEFRKHYDDLPLEEADEAAEEKKPFSKFMEEIMAEEEATFGGNEQIPSNARRKRAKSRLSVTT